MADKSKCCECGKKFPDNMPILGERFFPKENEILCSECLKKQYGQSSHDFFLRMFSDELGDK